VSLSEEQKAKIRWRTRRGMLELDLLLGRFCEKALDGLTPLDYKRLEALLEAPDPELLAWLMGDEKPTDPELASVVKWVQSYLNAR
jgi:antitoxin CptB